MFDPLHLIRNRIFSRHHNLDLALTFDDVLIVPQRSRVSSRKQIDTAGRLTPKISLKVPIVAANMDSVVGDWQMCAAMARAGGVAILHRFMTIEEMAVQIKKTKRAEALVIEDPYTTSATSTLEEAIKKMREAGVSSLPVVDENGKLLGLLTRRDVAAAQNGGDELVESLMSTELICGDINTSREKARELMTSKRVEKLPLVDEAGRLTGLITMKDINLQKRYPNATKDAAGRLVVGAAVGVRGDYLERALACEAAGADFLCLDIAHGHAEHSIAAVRALKETVSIEIIAGNVATYEGARDLIRAGADGIKHGVGAGSVCSTRIVAGVGVPTFSGLLEAARACREANIPLCADGGIRIPADMAKAIGIGAETIMIGNLLAGTDESPGDIIKRGGRLLKVHRGMASAGAARERKKLDEPIVERELYSGDETFNKTTPEGVEAVVPYRGSAHEVLSELVGGLRSAMSYSNSLDIPEYHKNIKFIRITNAGLIESHPHDVETN